MDNHELNIIADGTSLMEDVVGKIMDEGPTEEPIHVVDLDDVVHKHYAWKERMPRIMPFYAIKCHDNSSIVQALKTLGTGFDCASKGEIEKVLRIGVSPDRIVFAQPAKPVEGLMYAKKHGINMMTFDGKYELDKINKHFPEALLILRFRHDSNQVFAQFGKKFGCDAESEAPELLQYAKKLGLEVIGLSFHIGSGGDDVESYEGAIGSARKLFDCAKTIGYDFTLLDIGGGFPGCKDKPIDPYAERINEAIDKYFGLDTKVKFIAEPGRYYVTSAVTVVTNVQSKRLTRGADREEIMLYFVNDGIFGSFYSAGHEAQPVFPSVRKSGSRPLRSSIWGPTCDPLDMICENITLPELDIGDFVIFENAGAYSMVLANQFNGFPLPRNMVYVTQSTWQALQNSTKPEK